MTSTDFSEMQPAVTQQAMAQNERIKNVLDRFDSGEIIIPSYQRESDQWDDIKKSRFIESVLNRLTIPAFYFAITEESPDISEVVDGQQRLTTLINYFKGNLRLLDSEDCNYYGSCGQYAGKTYDELPEAWRRAFCNYNLTIVVLPAGLDLGLRLEIFRRINDGGTPLSDQDIRLSYYCESECVRFIQSVGITDAERIGSQRIITALGGEWAWHSIGDQAAARWKEWWQDTRIEAGQAASKMFLWFLVAKYHRSINDLLRCPSSMASLRAGFRGNTDEVLDVVCAQFRAQDPPSNEEGPLPNFATLRLQDFPCFAKWWLAITDQSRDASVAKNRQIALFIPSLNEQFGDPNSLADERDEWYWITKFIKSSRATAQELNVNLAEPKGKWTSQFSQIEGLHKVALEISRHNDDSNR